MSVRASLLAALVVGSSLTSAPAASAGASAPAVAQPGLVTAVVAADPVTPEVASVPVGPEPDGSAVRLDVSVWPQASGKHPVVLLAHGFGGSKDSVADQASALHERGYVVVAWS
ncbi:MAG TPA: ABC transporter ATP-binding protein, partial [Humibacillus sp.]|nr:ABC transporter ATP-binding protein [Humibacillus sp.]